MKQKLILRFFLSALFLTGLTIAAQAQATRTWVSGVGDDANPCSRTAPCRTLAGSISKTAAGGEINMIDSGALGAVTITKSITINAEPFLGGILVAGTNGIIINDGGTNTITVTIRGLDIEGLSLATTSSGVNGIRIFSAKSVSVEKCLIRNFGTSGISDERTGGGALFVTDSIIKNNGVSNIGIIGVSSPAITANIDNVKLIGSPNGSGLIVSGGNSAVVRNSVFFANFANGILGNDAGTEIWADNNVFNNNAAGIRTQAGTAIVRISGNLITKNTASLRPGPNGGQIISYGGNKISGNTLEVAPTSTFVQQ